MRRYEELLQRTDGPPGSSWGEWGPGDEVGTLNFSGPAQVVRAASLVRRGVAFNLDLPLTALDPALSSHRQAARHTIFRLSDDHRDDRLEHLYLQGSSQIDGLRHFRHFAHGWYNGASDTDIDVGSPTLGINRWADRGIVGRGVLIDMERHLVATGVDPAAVHSYPVSLVEQAARRQGVQWEKGDMLLLRTGWLARYLAEDPAGQDSMRRNMQSPGLEQSHETAGWLWDHGIALVASDNLAVECFPPVPDSPFITPEEAAGVAPRIIHTGLMHRILIPLLGYCLGELWFLDDLAADCAAEGIWEFLLTAKPLNLPGGVGSPANALAVK